MIELLLPDTVATAVAYEDDPDAALYPEEEEIVARAVPARRASFATARACARRALGELGVPPAPIPRGSRGEPRWPPGVVGSITHCDGYRASAVARRAEVAALGIDAEPHEPLPSGILSRVARPEEEPQLHALSVAEGAIHWDRLLFSAKESTFKAWYPLVETWLGFEDASVRFDTEGFFSVELSVPGPRIAGRELRGFAGRWLARDGLVVTAIIVPGTG